MDTPSSRAKEPFIQRIGLKKLFDFLINVFGKKSKKSFSQITSHLLEAYEKEGLIDQEEKKMFKNITSFGDKKVVTIMTSRADLIAVKQEVDLEEIRKIITQNGHTRIPVYKDNLDEIIGFIHSKDLAKFLCKGQEDFNIDKILRRILFVPGSMKLMDVMLRMRTSRIHMAIVLDEFGGVDGFVTIDDLVEEIVGDIEDEHDLPSDNAFFRMKKVSDKKFHLGGRVEITNAEEFLEIKIKGEQDDFQTMSGLIMALFKRVPQAGEEISKDNFKFKVIDSDNRVVKLVELVIN